MSEAEGKKVDESNIKITFHNVVPITLTRSFFSRYCHYPQFESVIIGCFIRVKVDSRDNDYRFARIEGLATVPKYEIEAVPVDQGLALSQGSSKQVINMDFASNSPVMEVFHFCNSILILQREFDRYARRIAELGGNLPSKRHLDKKIRDIQEIQEYKLKDVRICDDFVNSRPISQP